MNEVDFEVIEKAAVAEAVKFNVENGLQEERVRRREEGKTEWRILKGQLLWDSLSAVLRKMYLGE